MNLDKRSYDFLIYRQLKNHYDELSVKDLKWMVEYLEDRLEYYYGGKSKRIEIK